MKEKKKWFVECKCLSPNTAIKRNVLTGELQEYRLSTGLKKFKFTGTIEEYNNWMDQFHKNEDYQVFDCGEDIKKKWFKIGVKTVSAEDYRDVEVKTCQFTYQKYSD